MKRVHKIGLALLLALPAALYLILFAGGGSHQHRLVVTFRVYHSAKPGAKPSTVTLPKATVQKFGQPQDALDKLAKPTPAIAAVVPGQIKRAALAEKANRKHLNPLPLGGAAISVPGCRTMFIHSFSSRHGVRPVQFWLHYTASPNVRGWADVLSIVHYFTTVEASAHFVIDREGNCAYIVPIEQKAWTQMAANAFGINFEIIDTGREPSYLDPAGYAKLSSVLHYLSRLTGIPLRKGAVSGCAPTRSGIVTHWMGGLCSGGHVDIKPFDIDHEIAKLAGPAPPKLVLLCTVRNLQRRLGVGVDGVIGPKTRAAIALLQRRHGWRVTGHAGVKVAGALHLRDCHL